MADSLNSVEYWLKKVPYIPNILEYYDNVTYNIRFYMINHVYQKKLSIDRQNGIIPNNYQLPDDSKVIIAETGVDSLYDITSLTINTIHNSSSNNPSAISYQMDMKLKEINGCSLVNKITAVSKLLGYDSYVLQPYHVDVWFSGYEQSSGKPIKIIGNRVLTYEVMLNEVKTNLDVSGTMYNFIMTPVPPSTFNKSVNALYNIGKVEIKTGTLGEYKKKLQELLNKRFFDNNPNLLPLFPEKDFIVIDKFIDGDVNKINSKIVDVYNQRFQDDYIPINQYTPIKYENGNATVDQTTLNNRTQTEFKTVRNPNKINLGLDFENLRVDLNAMPQNTDSIDGGMTRPNNDDTFDTFFQNLCFNVPELRYYTARPVYRTEYIENVGGQEIQRIYIDIVFKKNNYLKYFLEKSLDKSHDKTAENDRIAKMQIQELQDLIYNGTLRKKYEWLFNGHDTSVLEVNSSVDKLWFANVETIDPIIINESSIDNVTKVNNNDLIVHNLESIRNGTIYKEKLENVIQISNRPLNGVRTLAADKRLYIDDIYNCIDDKTKKDFLSGRKILEKYDEFSKTSPSTESSNINLEASAAKVGYNNIYKSGNLVELKIKILGDPYWLSLCSDNVLYYPNNSVNASSFQHFSFRLNTALNQKLDGTYDLENTVDFSSIYQLIESVSLFEDGKFTQQLTGVISQPFIYKARLEI